MAINVEKHDISELIQEEATRDEIMRGFRRARNDGFRERNRLLVTVCRLAALNGARIWIGKLGEGTAFEYESSAAVFLELPTGQVSFQLNQAELGLFSEFMEAPHGKYDGHEWEGKWVRLDQYSGSLGEPVPEKLDPAIISADLDL